MDVLDLEREPARPDLPRGPAGVARDAHVQRLPRGVKEIRLREDVRQTTPDIRDLLIPLVILVNVVRPDLLERVRVVLEDGRHVPVPRRHPGKVVVPQLDPPDGGKGVRVRFLSRRVSREPLPLARHDVRSLDHHFLARRGGKSDRPARLPGHVDFDRFPVDAGADQHRVAWQERRLGSPAHRLPRVLARACIGVRRRRVPLRHVVSRYKRRAGRRQTNRCKRGEKETSRHQHDEYSSPAFFPAGAADSCRRSGCAGSFSFRRGRLKSRHRGHEVRLRGLGPEPAEARFVPLLLRFQPPVKELNDPAGCRLS